MPSSRNRRYLPSTATPSAVNSNFRLDPKSQATSNAPKIFVVLNLNCAFFASSSSMPASPSTTHSPPRKRLLMRSPVQITCAYELNTEYTSGLRALTTLKGDTATPLPAVDILEDDYGHHLHARIPLNADPESLLSASKYKLGHQNRAFQHRLQHRWGHPGTPLQRFGPSPRPSNVIIQRLPVFLLSPSSPRHKEFHPSPGRCASSTIKLFSQPHLICIAATLSAFPPQAPGFISERLGE